MKILKNEDGDRLVLQDNSRSAYFQGRFERYGKNCWNIKFYGYENENEIEGAQFWALGDFVKNKNGRYGFELISELLGREVESSTAGRSGGWLVVNDELTEAEFEKVTEYVESCLKNLPEFLKEERALRAEEEAEAARFEAELKKKIAASPEVRRAVELLRQFEGSHFEVKIYGYDVNEILKKEKET